MECSEISDIRTMGVLRRNLFAWIYASCLKCFFENTGLSVMQIIVL